MAKYYWPASANGELVKSNVMTQLQPGDTVVLQGNYKLIKLEGIAGTAEAPIIFTTEGDDMVQTGIGAPTYGIMFTGQHFKLLGRGKILSENPSGRLANNIIFGSSSEFTIDGVICKHAEAGILGNPTTGGIRCNLVFSNIVMENMATGKDVGQGTCEAIYLGHTSLKQIGPHQATIGGVLRDVDASYENVTFENITMTDLDGDGIQVAMAQNVIMRNCHITNWGRKNISSHRNAFLVGGSSQALIENCSATTGTGPYVQVFGHNKTIIKDCNFSGGATGTTAEDGIFIDKKNLDAAPLSLAIQNTVINGASRNAIRNYDAVSVTLCNVTMTSTQANTSGANFAVVNDCNETPPPPDPVQPVKPGSKPNKVRGGRVIRLRG